jgi:hypothetical protein
MQGRVIESELEDGGVGEGYKVGGAAEGGL